MKALRKNIYAVAAITLFVIALGMLGLFLALYSSSTAVDGTTVGSVYIGDQKPNTDARKQKLIKGVADWQKNAIYTISFQNVSIRIGDSVKIGDDGNPVTAINEETGIEEIVYNHEGLNILTFDYGTTNSKIRNNETDNLAYFTISDDNYNLLYNNLVETFGSEVTSSEVFQYQKLLDDIIVDAKKMQTKADYDLYDYIITDWSMTEVNQVDIENLSTSTVIDLVEIFKDKKIEFLPQKDPDGKLGFSAVEYFSKEEFSKMTSSEMSIIATGLAAVVMKTSLTVTVKNQGYISDRYYAYNNMTARINIKDGTDLRIINPETHSYTVTISKGHNDTSLSFVLEGCLFVNKYEINVNPEDGTKIIPYEVIYDSRDAGFDYDPSNPNMGIDREKKCYYYTYQEGRNTYLYSFVKTTTYVNNEKYETEVFPKQEFFAGQNELRYWTTRGYVED